MDIKHIALMIEKQIDRCTPDISHELITRLSTPQAKSVLSKLRSEAEASQDKNNSLRRLLMNGIDMIQIAAAITNNQCINIPGTREDVGSTYLEQQIGGIITRTWPTDIAAANFARETMGMKPQKEKTKEKQASIAARQAMRRKKKLEKLRQQHSDL